MPLSTMQRHEVGGVRVYNLAYRAWRNKGSTQGQAKDKKAPKRNETQRREYSEGAELIQDFVFPIAPMRVRQTADGNCILATGVYPPQLHCYDVHQLSQKFSRGIDAEILQIEVLTPDYRKFVLLQQGRWLEFHHQSGRYYRLRIPKEGRDIAYQPSTCDLLIGGVGPEVHRLNLQSGMFSLPFTTSLDTGTNVLAVNPQHELLGFGGANGWVECWDSRDGTKAAGMLDLNKSLQQFNGMGEDEEVTALKFDDDGITMAVGTSNGLCCLYDLRNNRPRVVKDHNYSEPINTIEFFRRDGDAGYQRSYVLSSCKKALKVWDREDGAPFTSMEPHHSINEFCLIKSRANLPPPYDCPSSGLILLAQDRPAISTYFIPQLGKAPDWCSFIQGLTYEEEVQQERAKDENTLTMGDRKFVTAQELEELGLTPGVGGGIKPWMHGYLVSTELYYRSKALQQTVGLTEYNAERKKKKQREVLQERIAFEKPKSVLVNQGLVDELIEKAKAGQLGEENRKKFSDTELDVQPDPTELVDPRFRKVFRDDRFKVDKYTPEYLRYNRHLLRDSNWKEKFDLAQRKRQKIDIAEQFAPVLEDGEQPEAPEADLEYVLGTGEDAEDADDFEEAEDEPPAGDTEVVVGEREARFQPRMFELKEGQDVFASAQAKGLALRKEKESGLSLGKRLDLIIGRKEQQEKPKVTVQEVVGPEDG
eukprot:EG_transcript_4866